MLTRRHVLKTTAAASLLAAAAPTSLALASVRTEKRLVVVILRGGADGLALVPVPGDANFSGLRRHLTRPALESGDAQDIPLDGFFALHGALHGLVPMWQAKQLAVVHATQTGYRDRSHFDAQDVLENGLNHVSARADGWLNRALSFFGPHASRLGLALGPGTPLILRGATPTASWTPRRLPRPAPTYLHKLAALSAHDTGIGPALAEGVQSDRMHQTILGSHEVSTTGSLTSRRGIAHLAMAAGKLLAAPVGARVAVLNIGGWDTHGYQRTALSFRMPQLNDTLLSLQTGLGSAWRHTVVLVVTEFGRTAAPNGTNGTDHGTAGVALLLGGAVRGGRVLGNWPGLAQKNLYQGRDLMPTTDLRAVFKGGLGRALTHSTRLY